MNALLARLAWWLSNRSSKRLRNNLPGGTLVRVNHARCHSYGVVWWTSDCHPWSVSVMLENGNVWWYEAWTVSKAEPNAAYPHVLDQYIKRAVKP